MQETRYPTDRAINDDPGATMKGCAAERSTMNIGVRFIQGAKGKSMRRWLDLIALAWGGLLSLSAMAGDPLVLALSKTPLSLPFYVAEEQNLFASEGVTVKINEIIGGHRSLQQVVEGQADLGTCSEAVVMFNSFKRNDFAILTTFVTTTEDVKVLTRNGTGITKAAHLANRRVGTIVGAAAHYYLTTLALLHGVDPKSIKVVGLQPETMARALMDGEVDAVSVWQPYAYKIEHEVSGAFVLPDRNFYTENFNLVASSKLLVTRDDDLMKLLKALDRAQRLIASEPEKAKTILRNRLQLDQAYIDWLWPRFRYQLTLDQSLLSTLESEARWARTEGLVNSDKTPNYLKFVYSAPLRRARSSAVGFAE